MNTVVWVMMAFTSHSWASPSLEFNSQEHCEAAIVAIQQQVQDRSWWRQGHFKGFCVKVEK
jgi:hypothetical protein